jgi:hypothetical protein
LEKTQALKGESDGPVWRAKKRISLIRSDLPAMRPPIALPCPSINLVAEWLTRSSPLPERLLEVRSGEAVIDDRDQIVLTAESTKPLKIDEIESRIERCLDKYQPCLRPDGIYPALRRVQIDIGCRDAPFREYLIQNLVRRTEEGTRGNDVITGFEESTHRRKDRRHAGSAGQSILGPFEPTYLLDQLRIVGIGKSGIDISRNLIGEECTCLLMRRRKRKLEVR